MINLKKLTLLVFFFSFAALLFSQTVSARAVIDTLSLGTPHIEEALKDAPSQVEVTVPTAPAGISFNSVLRGLIGMVSLLLIAFAFSRNRRSLAW